MKFAAVAIPGRPDVTVISKGQNQVRKYIGLSMFVVISTAATKCSLRRVKTVVSAAGHSHSLDLRVASLAPSNLPWPGP